MDNGVYKKVVCWRLGKGGLNKTLFDGDEVLKKRGCLTEMGWSWRKRSGMVETTIVLKVESIRCQKNLHNFQSSCIKKTQKDLKIF